MSRLNAAEKVGATGVVVGLLLVIAAFIGWIMNVVALCQSLDGAITAKIIARIIGIPVFPLGAILGYVA